MKSIRTYLLSRQLAGAALILSAAGAVIFLWTSRAIEAQYDRNLADRIQAFGSILFQIEDQIDFAFSDELMPEYLPGEEAEYFQLWVSGGPMLERSPALELPGETPLDLVLPTPIRADVQYWTAPLPGGRVGRYASQRVEIHHVYPEDGPERPAVFQVEIAVARSRAALVRADHRLLSVCVGGALLMLLLFFAITHLTVRKALDPADRLAAALEGVRMEDLPEQLDVGELPRELAPMAETADALIGRAARALQRERRTTSDIAHELRTPISEMLTASEVELLTGGTRGDAEQTLQSIRSVASRMGRSVSTVLKLGRLERGAGELFPIHFDFVDLLDDTRRGIHAMCEERGIDLRDSAPTSAEIKGDPDVLRIVLSEPDGQRGLLFAQGSAGAPALRLRRTRLAPQRRERGARPVTPGHRALGGPVLA